MADLAYEIDRSDDGLTFKLIGELDLHVAPALRALFDRELANAPSLVTVDLGDSPFIDSSIIATLVVALKSALQSKSEFRVVNCQQAVRDTFEIAGLLDRFGIA